ncbi:MAG: hypothetical protein ABSF71_05360 [Terriglobia bacterium]|jgi:hypothetical protein
MSGNGLAKASDFRGAVERSNVERVILPASGLSVLLCRPPVFAALAMGRAGTQLQTKITDAKPEEIKTEDIEAFTQWLSETLTRLFVQPRFAAAPEADQIGLADILIEDLKFIFSWLRGEVFSAGNRAQGTGDRDENSVTCNLSPVTSTEDLGRFPGRQGAASVLGGSGEAQPLPAEPTPGAHGDARLPAGLQRG